MPNWSTDSFWGKALGIILFLAVILWWMLYPPSAFAADASFGNTAQETNTGHVGNRQRGLLASTGGTGGNLDSMLVYLAQAANPLKCACYSSDGNTFIDSTEIIAPGTAGWWKLDFIGNASVSASTAYTLWCWSSSATNQMVDDPFVGFTRYTNTGATYGVWTSTIALGNATADEAYSLYAWYTESGVAPFRWRRRRIMSEYANIEYDVTNLNNTGVAFTEIQSRPNLLEVMTERDMMILEPLPTER